MGANPPRNHGTFRAALMGGEAFCSAPGLLSGCASTAGGTPGPGYTLTGAASRTVNADMGRTRVAACRALKPRGIRHSAPVRRETGAKIAALTGRLNITVKLERIPPRTTRILADVKADIIRKDWGRAAEIIRITTMNLGFS